MADFLNNGKALYIEGCDFAAENDTTALYAMFGGTFLSDGYPNTTGNVSTATGETGTIAAGMSFGHLFQQPPDNYVDNIAAGAGTILFKSQDGLNRAILYSGAGNNYRAIHSCFLFGALRDGASTKNALMAAYLNYLLN